MSEDLRFKSRYRIPSTRLRSWDYRWPGIYCVTICTHGRLRWFGEVVEDRMVLSAEGRVVEEEWRKIPGIYPHVQLDEWIVMPDHLHGILSFQNSPLQNLSHAPARTLQSQSLGATIAQFKSTATKRIRMDLKRPDFAWQTRFYDTVLREPADLDRMRVYIRENPARWAAKSNPNGRDVPGRNDTFP
jgi:REP element-mobilizing transposase RayT